ncbi:hypothetical protein HETIRDRAFT_42970, partial [Heterobasidion irregulare TC 32-1]
IIWNIFGNPLTTLLKLIPNPPPFMLTSRYIAKQCDLIDKVHSDDFLWLAK